MDGRRTNQKADELLLVFNGGLSSGEACDRYAERFDIVSDWKEVRHYIPIKGECIESIYFGINITEGKKERIVNYARTKLNPNIKLYQMRVDENAFRLKAELIY